jgi:hypothetical protein
MKNKLHTLNFTLLVLIFTFAFSSQAQAIDYYVDTNNGSASDSNPGTSSQPWKTISKANQTLAAGDTVFIKAGTYNSYIAPVRSGTSSNRITYRNYGTDVVTISGQNYGVLINGKSYINVSGINVTNSATPLYITGGSYNYIYNCSFTGGSGNYWGSQIINGSTYNRIDGCTFATRGSADSDGVFAIGTEATADATQYNLVENSYFYSGGHHVFALLSQFNTIRNNFMHNENWNPYGHRVLYLMGVDATHGIRNLVEGNRIGYAGDSSPASGGEGQTGQLTAGHYNIVRYNTYLKSRGPGMLFGTGPEYPVAPSYNVIYNNTFYANDQAAQSSCAIEFNDWGNPGIIQGNVFKNNIYYKNGSPVCSYTTYGNYLANQTFANNVADTNGSPLFVSESGSDPFSTTAPNLNLQATSPAKDFGGALTTVSSGCNTSTLTLSDAKYFQDGTFAPTGTISADWIAIGTVGNIKQISTVNYSTNQVTFADAFSCTNGQNVWLYKKSDGGVTLSGSAPDAGAYEFIQAHVPSAPGNLRIISP